jgi:6-phosphogluconolactonase (cycloisomerase 2 family)/FAD/FMN-containing dehydrogenase
MDNSYLRVPLVLPPVPGPAPAHPKKTPVAFITILIAVCSTLTFLLLLPASTYPTTPLAPHHPLAISSSLSQCILSLSPLTTFIDPSDLAYFDRSTPSNVRYATTFPALLVNVTTELDISSTVKCAARSSTEIGVMGGGHSFEGASTTVGVLLQMDNYHSVLDSSSTHITFQAGMRLGRLYGVFADMNAGRSPSLPTLTIGGGTCPTVGASGHILCGGYGMLGRTVGLTSDQVLSLTLVTPSGDVITASDAYNQELFWALRGSCSSAFGVISSITMKVTNLPSPQFTYFNSPTTANYDLGNEMAYFWQTYASVTAPPEFTSTFHFDSNGARMDGLYLGSKSAALAILTATGFIEALNTAFPDQDVSSFFEETDYLGAVRLFTGETESSVNDLLAITSLPPLNERHSARKAKSIEVSEFLTLEQIAALAEFRIGGGLNQIEWKAYGGNSRVGDLYTDERSPLLRGHYFEMHYGNSYHYDDTMSESEKAANDEALLNSINDIGAQVNAIVGSSKGYIGYIDYDLAQPGSDYFGAANARRLASLRAIVDPENILGSRASEYLYPQVVDYKKIVFLGAFDDKLTAWQFDDTGTLNFLQSTTVVSRNPAWLISTPGYLYATLEVSPGLVSAYKTSEDGALTLINTVTTDGNSPNNAYFHDGVVYAANSAGSVAVLSTDKLTGALQPSQTLTLVDGDEPIFLHQVTIYDDRLAFIVDRDGDCIHSFAIDASSGELVEDSKQLYRLGEGTGPRHLAYHPFLDGVVYLVSEFASTVTTLRITDSTFTTVDVQSALRDGESTEDMAGGEAVVSADGRFLYVSNRDTSAPNLERSSIAVFGIDDATGELSPLQHVNSGGVHPRHFCLVDNFIVIANKDSDNIVSYVIDMKSGMIDAKASKVTDTFVYGGVGSPIQVVFS